MCRPSKALGLSTRVDRASLPDWGSASGGAAVEGDSKDGVILSSDEKKTSRSSWVNASSALSAVDKGEGAGEPSNMAIIFLSRRTRIGGECFF